MKAIDNIKKTPIQNNLVSKELIIFSHIPKTAGTTINEIIESNYNSNQIINFYKGKNLNSDNFSDWINTFNESQNEFSFPSDSSPTKILRGHFGLSVHEFLNVKSCTYISLLRHPVDRVISHYYHFARPQSDSRLINIHPDMTIEKFVNEKRHTFVDNFQTRFLSSLGWQRRGLLKDQELYDERYFLKYGLCTREMLDLAKVNLNNYVVFGLQTRLQDSLKLFQNILGWENVDFTIQNNVNPKKPRRETFNPKLIHAIEQENKLDLELYDYAEKMFDKQLDNFRKGHSKIVDNQIKWRYPRFPEKNKIVRLGSITQLNPNDDKAHAKLARIQANKGDMEKAVIGYKKAISINHEQPNWVFIGLGKALSSLQKSSSS